MATIPGDIVRHGEVERIVVDITGDGLAVLRDEHDLELEHPVVEPVAELEVVGHVDSVEGWTENAPGEWSKS